MTFKGFIDKVAKSGELHYVGSNLASYHPIIHPTTTPAGAHYV